MDKATWTAPRTRRARVVAVSLARMLLESVEGGVLAFAFLQSPSCGSFPRDSVSLPNAGKELSNLASLVRCFPSFVPNVFKTKNHRRNWLTKSGQSFSPNRTSNKARPSPSPSLPPSRSRRSRSPLRRSRRSPLGEVDVRTGCPRFEGILGASESAVTTFQAVRRVFWDASGG